MDYHNDLLNKAMYMLSENGIEELDKIKRVLIHVIGDYEITERITDLSTLDNGNDNLIKMFFATKRIEGGSIKTAKTRYSVIRRFMRDINKPLTEVTTFDILRWMAEQQKCVCLSTANSYQNILSSLFHWMHTNNYIDQNPMENIKQIRYPKSLKKAFTPVEVDALKTACVTKLDRAMVELLLSSGLRCEELCNLKWKDIDWETKDIRVIEGKGNKNRITMMDDITRKYLLEYRNSLPFDSEYVFAVKYGGTTKCRTTDSVWRKLNTIAKKANVDEVSPHKFRRTFATTLYKRGLDIRMIQKLMGHSSVQVTTIYLGDDIDMLRDAYKRCV